MNNKEIRFTTYDFNLVGQNLLELLKLYEPLLPKGTTSDISLNYQKRLNIERNFIIYLIENLNKILPDYSKIVLMWDIDGVIGSHTKKEKSMNLFGGGNQDYGWEREFEIRPALPILFEKIKDAFPNVEFGMFTNQVQLHLDKVLFDVNMDLHSNNIRIEKYFNPDFVFANGSIPKIEDDGLWEMFPEIVQYFETSFTKRREISSLGISNIVKVVRILEWERLNPGIKFIPIDDLPYAKLLDGITIDENLDMYRSVFAKLPIRF